MPEPFELSVAEAAGLIRRRELSPLALVESLLGRIDAFEPNLKAWVYLDREAVLSEAREMERRSEAGQDLGPLHGVPIGLKDIYYTAGIPTTACSKLYADFVPEYDATTVTLLKRAGALMLGKAVTTEFACMDPSPTINPWNAAHTPDGQDIRGRRNGVGRRVDRHRRRLVGPVPDEPPGPRRCQQLPGAG